MRKKILLLSIILSIVITFFQAYDAKSLEQLTYVIALGIDKSNSPEEPISLTIQLAIPESSENGGTKLKSQIQTVNCNSFHLGLAMLDLKNIKALDLSHCTAIVISEELAKEEISEFINTLSNDIKVRPTCNVLICQDKASEFLQTASQADDLSSKFYSSHIASAKNVSYVSETTLSDIYSSINQDIKDPVAVYSFTDNDKIESIGLAIFKHDKMVARISGLDTICHNILTNNFEKATIEVYNPYNGQFPISVDISHSQKTKISVKLENNVPKIHCKLGVEARISSASSIYDFSSHEALSLIEAEVNKFLTDSISNFLYRCSKEYESDCIGFEGYFKRNYLTQKEIDKYDWNELYPKSVFEIDTSVYLVSGYLFSKN